MLHSDNYLLDFFPKVLDIKFFWHYRYGMKYDKKKKLYDYYLSYFNPIMEYEDSTTTRIARESEYEDFTTTQNSRK